VFDYFVIHRFKCLMGLYCFLLYFRVEKPRIWSLCYIDLDYFATSLSNAAIRKISQVTGLAFLLPLMRV